MNWKLFFTLCKSQIYSMPEIFFLSPDSRVHLVIQIFYCKKRWLFFTLTRAMLILVHQTYTFLCLLLLQILLWGLYYLRGFLSLKQCAAEITWLASMIVPPQMCPPHFRTETCQSQFRLSLRLSLDFGHLTCYKMLTSPLLICISLATYKTPLPAVALPMSLIMAQCLTFSTCQG